MSRIMVISPHPDDEAIGCGGTVQKHVLAGDVVHVEVLTSGEKGGHAWDENETARRREQETLSAAAILGIERVEFHRQPDGRLNANQPLIRLLANRIESWKPHIIYVPHAAEQHPDHRAAARAVRRALKLVQGTKLPRVLAYEVWTPLQRLDEIVDITPHLETKLRAIAAYDSQCRVMDFVAAARGLARYRGEMHCWPGGDYAEAFAEISVNGREPLKNDD
jgi:LmbE family N-acetylglucosaminyl deacetylase